MGMGFDGQVCEAGKQCRYREQKAEYEKAFYYTKKLKELKLEEQILAYASSLFNSQYSF